MFWYFGKFVEFAYKVLCPLFLLKSKNWYSRRVNNYTWHLSMSWNESEHYTWSKRGKNVHFKKMHKFSISWCSSNQNLTYNSYYWLICQSWVAECLCIDFHMSSYFLSYPNRLFHLDKHGNSCKNTLQRKSNKNTSYIKLLQTWKCKFIKDSDLQIKENHVSDLWIV